MEDAIRHNNTTKIDYLNKQLSDIHINQVLQEAEKKTRYELKLKVKVFCLFNMQKEKELHKSKYKPILNWKYDSIILVMFIDLQRKKDGKEKETHNIIIYLLLTNKTICDKHK